MPYSDMWIKAISQVENRASSCTQSDPQALHLRVYRPYDKNDKQVFDKLRINF